MNPERLTKRIYNNFDKNLKRNVRWFMEVKKDLVETDVTAKGIQG